MTSGKPVIVKQLPERFVVGEAEQFFNELQPLLHSDRPRLVFDMSRVRELDSSGVEVLLECMQQAMKRNGDVKLAAVPPTAAVVLELVRVDRFFEIYEDVSDAMQSFQRFQMQDLERGFGVVSKIRADAREAENELKLTG
jgi:anti-anti-sigma factor